MKISILLPKTQVLQYLTNYVRILSGGLCPNVRASSSAKCRHPRTADSTSRINCSPLTAPPLRFEYHNILIKLMIQHILPTSDSDNKLVSLSGMAETPRLQAKQVLYYRQATCHSAYRAGIQEIRFLDFWMPDRVRHNKKQLISNQPDMEPLVL